MSVGLEKDDLMLVEDLSLYGVIERWRNGTVRSSYLGSYEETKRLEKCLHEG